MRRLLSMMGLIALSALCLASFPPKRLQFSRAPNPGNPSSPFSLPLAHQSSPVFTFLGSFKAPNNITGGGALSVSGSTLYVLALVTYNGGHNSSFGLAAMSLPTLSGTAALNGSNAGAPCNSTPCASGSGTIVAPTMPHDSFGNPSWDWGQNYNTPGPSSATVTISGTTLTVSGTFTGAKNIAVLTQISGAGIPRGTYVTALGTGTGGTGTYTVANFNGASLPSIAVAESAYFLNQSIAANTFGHASASSITSGVLTVGGTYTGNPNIAISGTNVSGLNVPFGTYIAALGTGTGGAGTYTLGNFYGATIPNIAAETMWFNGGGGGAGARPLGTLVYGGKLYATGGVYYDANLTNTGWITQAATTLTGWGAINQSISQGGLASCGGGPFYSPEGSGTYTRFFSGSLGVVPAIWEPYFGGPLYTTSGNGAQSGLSIATASPNGFDLATFDPANYNSTGAAITLSQALQYCWQGPVTNPGNPHGLSYRGFSGPFPTSPPGGGYAAYTATGTIANGATTFNLTAGFTEPYSIERDGTGARYQVTFSDGETRDVHLTGGSIRVPDNNFSNPAFAALTGCGGGGCSATVTVRAYGDQYASVYDGPFGYGFWLPGSRTFMLVSIHGYGPLHTRGVGCTPNSSSTNTFPIPPDTSAYQQLQVTAYDSLDLYSGKAGANGANIWTPSPYETWAFPNWNNYATAGCLNSLQGFMFFDPNTNILYAIFTNQNDASGHMIVNEWSVTPLS